MGTLKYVGRRPDSSDYSVYNKGQLEADYQTVQVDNPYVTSAIQDSLPALASLAYVNNQDSLLASSAAVLAADNNYVPASELTGVSGGVVPLDVSGSIPLKYLPATLKTSRPVTIVDSPTVYLNGTQSVGPTPGVKKFKAAQLIIPDPGFPYIPLPFAAVQGGAMLAPDKISRSQTSACYGQLTVLDASNVRYGWGLCTGREVYDVHQCLPFADGTVNPTTRSLVEGPLTLSLWLGLYAGTTYTFSSNFPPMFCVVCFPGVR